MSTQIKLNVEPRPESGKGAAGRLRREGRVPAIVYGYEVEPTPVSVDSLDLYHALHTEAGRNALMRVVIDGETHLAVARDVTSHPVKGTYVHVDLLAVDKDQPISVEVPVHLIDEDDVGDDGGVVNQVLYSVSMLVRPLEVPNAVELSIAGMEIGDVRRVEDLTSQLPEGAEFDIDIERTVVTINAPITEAELEALEETAGIETDEADDVDGEDADGADESEGDDGDGDDES
ncbi:MAG: 50S ribosomal protein L25 [Nitriliruptoraceae bacterium]